MTHSGRSWRAFSSHSFAPLRARCAKPSRFWASSVPHRAPPCSICAADLAATLWSLPAVASGSRAAATREGLTVEFVQEDMRHFHRPAAFDLALNLFSSFGYFADVADDLQVLRQLHGSLKPGGQVLLEMVGKETLARTFQPRTWHRHAERDEYLLEELIVRGGWRWLEHHWIWIRGAEQQDFTFGIRLYSGAELTTLLAEAGFSGVQLYGSLAGTPYDQTAQRLVTVATK